MTQNQGPGWGEQYPPAQQPPDSPPQWSPPPPPTTQPGGPTKYCPTCGSSIDSRAELCPRCGVRQAGVVGGEGKSRVAAALLALVFGSFGIHRFYLGQIIWGVVYLVFFWTGIPGIVALFEGIYYLTRSDVEWAQRYGGPVRDSSSLGIGCGWILVVLGVLGFAYTVITLASLL